jgi:hypothetical protein
MKSCQVCGPSVARFHHCWAGNMFIVFLIKNIIRLKPTSTPNSLNAAVKLAAETKSATNSIFMLNNAKRYQSDIFIQ